MAIETFEHLAAELQASSAPLLSSILQPLTRRLPVTGPAPAFSVDDLAGFSGASLEVELGFLRAHLLPEHCPQVDAEAARTLSQVGELDHLLDWYWSCQAALQADWFARVERVTRKDLERRRLQLRGADFFFNYAELLSGYVAAIYRRESERAELRARGTPGFPPRGREALTVGETRVAQLAVESPNDLEIADRLHVTLATVEGTLSSAYAKLGISGHGAREALGPLLDASSAMSPNSSPGVN